MRMLRCMQGCRLRSRVARLLRCALRLPPLFGCKGVAAVALCTALSQVGLAGSGDTVVQRLQGQGAGWHACVWARHPLEPGRAFLAA